MNLSQLQNFDFHFKRLRVFLVISLLAVYTAGANVSPNSAYSAYPNSASLPAGNAPAFQGDSSNVANSTANPPRSTPVFTPTQTTMQNTSPSVPQSTPLQGQGTRNTTVVPARAPNTNAFSELDLLMGPRTVIARPGSEVILRAGLRDRSGYLRTNQRIDWSISPQSVGHFSRIQARELANILVLDFVKPQIISDTQAVTTTSRSEIILDRGTPNLNDDIVVRRGESWVSISSPREGITTVTARSPKISGNQVQAQTSRIVWVDAAVKLPKSRLLDFGSAYTLTTALRRVSDSQPLERWRVRYEICNNSTAVFGDGNKMLEVYTNREGVAKIEMRQPIAREEETIVSVQIIRPAEGDFTSPVIVQDSKVHYRWTPNTINITKSMPKEAYIGAVVPAMISVTNLTNQELYNVRIVDLQQPGLVLKGAVPEGQDAQDGRQWLVERLAPHETYTIQLNYRVEQPGAYTSFAQVQTQKLGNNLIVECSATLRAGSDTSPFTPELPRKNLNANGNQAENESDSSPSPTPTFAPDEGAEGENQEIPDPFGNTTQPLPPPDDNDKEKEAPKDGEEKSTEEQGENSNENSSIDGKIPEPPNKRMGESEKPVEIYARSPKRAPVYPQESPNAQITLDIIADAQVSINQPFSVSMVIGNLTLIDQRNVGIQVSNTRGLSNQNPTDDIYFIERNIDLLPSQKQLRLRMEFLPILLGEQVVEVMLKLSNGKEYRREAHIRVLEGKNNEPPVTPPHSTPATEGDMNEKTKSESTEGDLTEPPTIAPELPAEAIPSIETPEPETGSLNALPDSLELPTGETTPENRATRRPANPLPKTGPATVGKVIEQENGHGDPAFTIKLEESAKKIQVGDKFSYVLELINTSSASVKRIELLLALPPENLKILQDEVAGPTEVEVNDAMGLVKYAPISEIEPGQTVQYKVKVEAIRAGTIQAHVQLLENGAPRSQKNRETIIEEKGQAK